METVKVVAPFARIFPSTVDRSSSQESAIAQGLAKKSAATIIIERKLVVEGLIFRLSLRDARKVDCEA